MNVSANDLVIPADAPKGSFYKFSVYLNVNQGQESASGQEIKIADGQLYIVTKSDRDSAKD
jgi:hypothetical protein